MVLTAAMKSYIALHQHLVVLVTIFEHARFRHIFRVKSAKNFLHVHFSYPLRCAF